MNNIEWIFFDIGGTLVDESECYNHRIRDIVSGTSVPFDEFYDKVLFFAHTHYVPVREAIIFFRLPPLKTKWHTEDERLYPEADETLKYLSENGYKIGIIANQSAGTQQRLESFGLMKYISAVVSSAEEGVAKPDLEIFRIALSRTGCSADKAVMIGDRLDNDIYPAKQLGMKTIRVLQGFSAYLTPESDEYKADCTVSDLSGLYKLFPKRTTPNN